ncbi:MAG: FeoC-like transcriptional regulator [Spirochaetales bacterium]
MLRDVRSSLKALEVASASQLAAELHAPRGDVEMALEFWIQRGNVRVCRQTDTKACGTSCTRCPIGALSRNVQTDARLLPRNTVSPATVYEWVST